MIDKLGKKQITLLALSWRDIKSPNAGGAEIYTYHMLQGAVKQGIRIIHFSPLFKGSPSEETIDGIQYLRKGNVLSVIWHAQIYYLKHRSYIDYVIDQCNTHRFFTKFWVKKQSRIFLIFQLTREIWDYHMPFPFNHIGRLLENAMLRLSKKDVTITESQSTMEDLIKVGFRKELIHVIPVGLSASAVLMPDEFSPKETKPTFIYVGRYARYKGINYAISALSLMKKTFPSARLWVVGKPNPQYIKKVLNPLCKNLNLTIGKTNQCDIVIKGFVSDKEKQKLQSSAHALIFPSVREGWGMIVSEAAVCGTPSIVFNSPGCRDAVDFGRAGYLCRENSTEELCRLMLSTQQNREQYENIRNNAYEFSKALSWENTTEKFVALLQSLH